LAKEKFYIPRKLNRILEELEQQERSILWLSKKTGFSYQTVYDYAHNIRQPNLTRLKMIAMVLRVQSSELVVG